MDVALLRKHAAPGDIILKGDNVSCMGRLISYGQRCLTVDGKPSLYEHGMFYIGENTIAECTMDFEEYDHEGRLLPWSREGFKNPLSRLNNGPQYNGIEKLVKAPYGLLLHFPFTERQRADILESIDTTIRLGIQYSILGLFGALAAYYILKTRNNPLNRKHTLFCTAFQQHVFSSRNVGIDFAQGQWGTTNVAPEMIARYKCPGLLKVQL